MRSLLTALFLAATVIAAPSLALAQTPTDVKAAAKSEVEKKERQVSPGQQAMRDRQKACSAEWKTVKGTEAAAGKTWPKFCSECNKRLKEKPQRCKRILDFASI